MITEDSIRKAFNIARDHVNDCVLHDLDTLDAMEKAILGEIAPPVPVPLPEPEPIPQPAPLPAKPLRPLGVNLPGPRDYVASARAKLTIDCMKFARLLKGAVFKDGQPQGAATWRLLSVDDVEDNTNNFSTHGALRPKIDDPRPYTLYFNYVGTTGQIPKITLTGDTTYLDTRWDDGLKCYLQTWLINSSERNVDLVIDGAIKILALTRPGYTLKDARERIVTDEFKAWAKPFSLFRFMDLTLTNWHDEADAAKRFADLGADMEMGWDERPKDGLTWDTHWGVPIEMCLRIAAECGVNPWINLPWCANYNFYQGLTDTIAVMREVGIIPDDMVIHIENFNEPWNEAGGFYSSKLYVEKTEKMRLAGALKHVFEPNTNKWYGAYRRLLQDLMLCREYMRDMDIPVCAVFAGQHVDCARVVDALNWYKRVVDADQVPNAIAYAPYIAKMDGTEDEIIDGLDALWQGRRDNIGYASDWLSVKNAFNIDKLFTYEIGIDLGKGLTNIDNRVKASMHEDMWHTAWKLIETTEFYGVDMCVWFTGIVGRTQYMQGAAASDDALRLDQPIYEGLGFTSKTPPVPGGVNIRVRLDVNSPWVYFTSPSLALRWWKWHTGHPVYDANIISTDAKNFDIEVSGFIKTRLWLTEVRVECDSDSNATLEMDQSLLAKQSHVPFTIRGRMRFDRDGTPTLCLKDQAGDIITPEYLEPRPFA